MLNERDIIEQFRAAMAGHGLVVTGTIEADGKFHRMHVDGDKKSVRNGWYVLHVDGKPSGAFGCNKRFNDAKFTWSAKGIKPLTPEERRAFREQMEAKRAAREAEEAQQRANAAWWANQLWDKAAECVEHPYLTRKGVKSHGLRVGSWEKVDDDDGEINTVSANALMVPIRDAGKRIHSLQAIFPNKIYGDRDKDFVRHGAKAGLFYSFGKPQAVTVAGVERKVIMIGEGYATLASVHECTGHASIVAFDAGNLMAVAKTIREKFPEALIVMLADNDQWTLAPIKNPGLTRATEAAKAVGGVVAMPSFPSLADGRPTDFNDLHQREGADAVRAVIEAAINPPQAAAQAAELAPWEGEAEDAPPPADDDGDDVAPPDQNGHFVILGYNRGTYYIFQCGKRQIIEITKGDITEIGLIALAQLNWWELQFPGDRAKIDTKMAAEFIIRTAERRGIYDPSKVRGRGAWLDAGRSVYHHGDCLTVDGEVIDVTKIASRYVYELDRSLPPPDDVAMSDEDGRFLIELAQMFRWSKPGSAIMLAGWVALAPMCGALAWRPHCWLSGGAGSGKTTVLKDYVYRLLGDVAMFAQGNSSEAGIRQTLAHDARPVLFDESESNEEGDARRVQSILSLIRQASTESEAQTYKGTAGGAAMTYHIRSMFCLASIQVALKQQADIERLSVLVLRGKKDDPDPAGTWERMSEQLYKLKRDVTLPGRLFRRSMELLPITLQNIHVFSKVAAQVFGNQRDGDQYGTLIAGAWSMISREVATEEQARAMITRYDWSEHRDKGDTDEGERALASLMGAFVRVKAGIELTVRDLTCAAYGEPSDTVDISQAVADAILQRHGMKVRGDRLLLSNNNDALRRLMHDTTFAADYRGVLLRVTGADRNDNKPVKFNGVQSKCISLPLGPLVSSDGDAPAF